MDGIQYGQIIFAATEKGKTMAVYKVWVRLECEYDDIEAESEEEAFIIASDFAMGGGSWDYSVEEVEDEEDG